MDQVHARTSHTLLEVQTAPVNPPYFYVALSNAVVSDGRMLLSAYLPAWNKDVCFYVDLDSIDNPRVRLHVMWKMSGDSGYVIQLRVSANIAATDWSQLHLNDWRFL